MRAVIISSFGGPEVLQVQERPMPVPARGEVRIRVMATAVNRADLLQRAGHYPAPRNVPADIPGLELAGTVDALGEGVTEWELGDRVFGLVGGGAYADHVVTHARALARMPPQLSFTDAAAVPEAFMTAYDAMVDQAHLAAGETVLITAVGSGVGTAAVQIARAIGARAIGTARTPDKLERAVRLGLADGIDAREGSFAPRVLELTSGAGAAVILELVGGSYLPEDVACAAIRARIALVGMLGGSRASLDWGQVLQKRLMVMGTTLRSRPLEQNHGGPELRTTRGPLARPRPGRARGRSRDAAVAGGQSARVRGQQRRLRQSRARLQLKVAIAPAFHTRSRPHLAAGQPSVVRADNRRRSKRTRTKPRPLRWHGP